MGGDGTVNETVNGIAQGGFKSTFGFIPVGTVNDMSRALVFIRIQHGRSNVLISIKHVPLISVVVTTNISAIISQPVLFQR